MNVSWGARPCPRLGRAPDGGHYGLDESHAALRAAGHEGLEAHRCDGDAGRLAGRGSPAGHLGHQKLLLAEHKAEATENYIQLPFL